MDDFFSQYLSYTEHTESPRIYHRWCAIAAVGALLGRKQYISFGHFRVFPNIYCMLIGNPAARKSAAIKLSKKLISAAGYRTYSADKTSKEKFLLDLEGLTPEIGNGSIAEKTFYDDTTQLNLWADGESAKGSYKEVFIMADEFNELAGAGTWDFCSLLGNLWDWDDEAPYSLRFKNSKSVSIYQPTVSLIGGNTPESFARAFPAEILGQGFLTRIILINGERTGKKYTFPPIPAKHDTDRITAILKEFRGNITTVTDDEYECLELTNAAVDMIDKIYQSEPAVGDARFIGYDQRRHTNLLKLCIITTAAFGKKVVDDEVVVYVNTILTAAERQMPRALGEFGKSKNSDVSNKVMELLFKTNKPLSIMELWKDLQRDLEKITMLGEIMQGLNMAKKVMFIKEKGWLPRRDVSKQSEYVDFRLLTSEERDML